MDRMDELEALKRARDTLSHGDCWDHLAEPDPDATEKWFEDLDSAINMAVSVLDKLIVEERAAIREKKVAARVEAVKHIGERYYVLSSYQKCEKCPYDDPCNPPCVFWTGRACSREKSYSKKYILSIGTGIFDWGDAETLGEYGNGNKFFTVEDVMEAIRKEEARFDKINKINHDLNGSE